jgi:putative hemolysin
LLDGAMPAQELKSRLDLDGLPEEESGVYATLAGLMQTLAGDLMAPGDRVQWAGWEFEVLAVEARRIERVVARPMPA